MSCRRNARIAPLPSSGALPPPFQTHTRADARTHLPGESWPIDFEVHKKRAWVERQGAWVRLERARADASGMLSAPKFINTHTRASERAGKFPPGAAETRGRREPDGEGDVLMSLLGSAGRQKHSPR